MTEKEALKFNTDALSTQHLQHLFRRSCDEADAKQKKKKTGKTFIFFIILKQKRKNKEIRKNIRHFFDVMRCAGEAPREKRIIPVAFFRCANVQSLKKSHSANAATALFSYPRSSYERLL